MPSKRKTRSRSGSKKRGGGWFSSTKKNYNIGKPKAPRLPWHISSDEQANAVRKSVANYKRDMEVWSSRTKKAATGEYEEEIAKLKDENKTLLKELDDMENDKKECERERERDAAKARAQKSTKGTRHNLFGSLNLNNLSNFTPRSFSSLNNESPRTPKVRRLGNIRGR